MTLFIHEFKTNIRSVLIWSFALGLSCAFFLLMFKSMQSSLKDMASAYSSMGAISTAFGLDQISIASLNGYFAIEIGVMHSLGSALFASMLGAKMISKEEEGHTSEFLNTLPFGRNQIIIAKYLLMTVMIILFQCLCFGMYALAAMLINEHFSYGMMLTYALRNGLMMIELSSVCFLLSSFMKKTQGAAIGLALIAYGMDVMLRIVTDLKAFRYITPFYYANASDIFSKISVKPVILIIAVLVVVASFALALVIYHHRDLQA